MRGGRMIQDLPALYSRDKMQSGRIVVTGMGALTPVGLDVPTTWDNIVHGRSGIAPVEGFETDDLERAERYLASQEVSARWQDAMAELLVDRVPDGGPPPLEEIFRLD